MLEFRKILFYCFLLFPLIVVAQEEGTVEEEAIFIIGLGPTLELEESLYGINGRFYYGVNESFCFGPEVSFFPYQSVGHDEEQSIVDLNFNAHYIFELTEKLGLYPLAGANYTIDKIRVTDEHDENETESEFGLNYGFGAHYEVSNFFIFSEFKGVIGRLSDEFITVGIIHEF